MSSVIPTIIEQTFEKIKQASGRCEWAPTGREGGTRTPLRLPVSHIAGSAGEDVIGVLSRTLRPAPAPTSLPPLLNMPPPCGRHRRVFLPTAACALACRVGKGGHYAIQEAISAQFTKPPPRDAFRPFGRLRRTRSQFEYDDITPITADDVEADSPVVRTLHAMAQQLVDVLPVFIG
jgi:hypothetical protein